jgi:signal-transduction protein with cAMP-binding, CBS, and nucleotidyltransferase domain
MKVAEVMHTPAVACQVTAPVKEVARLMQERNVGSVLVVDHGGYVAGIVTDRDLAIRGYGQNRSGDVEIVDLMTRDVATVLPGATIEFAADRMMVRGVRRLPVVDDDGCLHGVIALDDLVRQLTREADHLVSTLGIQAVRHPAVI